MSPERRPWLISTPFVLLATLLLAWSAYWYTTLTRTKEGFSAFETNLAGRGGAFSCNEEAWSGYPFRVEVSCARLVLRLSRNGPTFETQGVRALARAYAINDVVALAEGPSRLTFADGRSLDLAHAPMNAGFRLDSGGKAEAMLEITSTVLKEKDAVLAKGGRLKLAASSQDDRSVAFRIAASDGLVSAGSGTGISIPTFAMEGLIGNLPPGFAARPGDLLTAAAISGARLDVSALDAVVEQSRMSGKGEVTLDARGFPDGRIGIRVSDPDRFLAALAAKGIVDRKAAGMGMMLLGLLMRKNAAPVDLTFREGRIFWGPIPLLKHGPIR